MATGKINILLIGGTSHCGKTTFAKLLSAKLDAKYIATDSLARHPGRPWNENPKYIPDHVREHYSYLSADELIADVLQHYHKLWPEIQCIIEVHVSRSENLILEGSALWPTTVHTLNLPTLWLTASDDFLKKRIHVSSNYQEKTLQEQKLINQFVARTLKFNEMMMAEVNQRNLPYADVEYYTDMEGLVGKCMEIGSRKPGT